jgi:hypothetical protein
MIKSRRLRWTGKIRNAYKILVRNPKGKRPLGEPRSTKSYRLIIKLFSEKQGATVWIGFIWLRIGFL